MPVKPGPCLPPTPAPDWPLLWMSGCDPLATTYRGDQASACLTRDQLREMTAFKLAWEAWVEAAVAVCTP